MAIDGGKSLVSSGNMAAETVDSDHNITSTAEIATVAPLYHCCHCATKTLVALVISQLLLPQFGVKSWRKSIL